MNFKKVAVIFIHALIGWVLCAAMMGIGMQLTSLEITLIIHAIGAPIVFIIISTIYFLRFNYTTPIQTALAFVGFVMLVDFFVVALLINKSLDMFTSLLGTWIPFVSILISTYAAGFIVNAANKAIPDPKT